MNQTKCAHFRMDFRPFLPFRIHRTVSDRQQGESLGNVDRQSLGPKLSMVQFEDFLAAWRANQSISLELLGLCADDDFELKPGKGKTIRSNFTHLVSVRKMWCEESLAKRAAEIPKLDWKSAKREEIIGGLSISSEIMEALLEKKWTSEKQTRFPLPLFLAYVIAHEAHHRSQIEIALRINGREPDDKALYGLWEWSRKVGDTF